MATRVLLATAGSLGDLFPTLGIALGLKGRGYEPIVATTARYRELVEREQIRFHAVRPDLNPFDPAILARAMDPHRGSEVVVRELAMGGLWESYEDFVAIARDTKLVVSHPITFAAPIAAEHSRVPWLSTALTPLSFFSRDDFPVLPTARPLVHLTSLSRWIAGGALAFARLVSRSWVTPVLALRRELGLPDRGHPLFEGQFSAAGTLALFSKVWAAPRPDWPPRTTVTGFVFYDRFGQMPADVRRFVEIGDPPIVFTLGSAAVGAPGAAEFFQHSVEAARQLNRRAVLLVGRDGVGRIRQPVPPGLLVADYVPHHLLFPSASVIVHHGGAGTTAQALRAGRPALIVPIAHDQPDNAARVVRLGAARVLDTRRYSATRAARAIARLLGDARYRHAAAGIARPVSGEDGVHAACDAIETALQTAER